MITSILFLTCLALVMSIGYETKLKVDYYEKLIKDSIVQAKNYKLPVDNSEYFINASKGIKDFGTFDFIVVGAGSSGCVVASRLSEVESFNILLLEAGGWDDDLTNIPYMAPILQLSKRNWGYYTTTQKNGCYGSKGRKCEYPRGKLVGGSGSINNLAYVRGNKEDYDKWASLGNPGWSFEEVLPYFKKLENFEFDEIDLNYRGFAGPVNSVFSENNDRLLSKSLIELGLDMIVDYNAEQQIGSSRNQKSTENARRVSGATAYVRPSMSRHNFNVTVNALVTKVLINEFTKTAYGVEFIKNRQRYIAKTKKEVILSAGAINTPQLLMLSGIGPINELQKHSIPIISDLPVGQQLKDQFAIFLSYKNNRTKEYMTYKKAIEEYLDGTGILGRPGNKVGISFINTRNASSSVPNIEIGFFPPSPFCKRLPLQTNYTDEIIKYQKQSSNSFQINIILSHPKSSGTLKLQSNNIIDYPLIDVAIFREEEDLEIMYEAIRFINKIVKTKPAKKENARLIKFEFCDKYTYDSKAYWFSVLKYLATTALHVSTTAKMGPKLDPYAVVDYNLRVYGVKGLRVADCSVMPTPVSGHNNAPAFMIGEKAADIVKMAHPV